MSKVVIASLAIILIILAAATGVYIYLKEKGPIELSDEEKAKEEEEKLIQEKYPDIIKGIVIFSEERITIKTEENQEYSLWPVQPRVVYERQGISDGQQVEIRGRILLGQRILAYTIKPI